MEHEKKRLLFVDDEPNVLQGLRRMLRSMRHEWQMSFAGGGEEALGILETEPFDVVVSDMRMPGMDGAQLLKEVKKRHPRTVRIVLSGQSDDGTIIRSVGPTHQYLSKPCNADILKCAVARACALRDLLASDTLKQVVSRMSSLPSLPSMYQDLVKELRSRDADVDKIARIISGDVGMTAKILQLVNSAFFGLYQHVSSPKQAVSILGLRTIRALVLSVQVFSQFEQANLRKFPIEALMNHSMATGTFARAIANAENAGTEVADEALLAGVLHDAGKLVLASNLPDRYARVRELAGKEDVPLWEAERKVLDAAHPDVGAYLLGLWGLSTPVVEALAYHHTPSECVGRGFSALTAVHVANALEHEGNDAGRMGPAPQVSMDYLDGLGLAHRLDAWRESCRTVGPKREAP